MLVVEIVEVEVSRWMRRARGVGASGVSLEGDGSLFGIMVNCKTLSVTVLIFSVCLRL